MKGRNTRGHFITHCIRQVIVVTMSNTVQGRAFTAYRHVSKHLYKVDLVQGEVCRVNIVDF